MAPQRSKGPYQIFEDVVVIREGEKAILVAINGGEYWCPKSQILEDSEVQGEGDDGTLITTRWWAEQEGIED